MQASSDDLGKLYSESGVMDYHPEPVRVVLGDGRMVEALAGGMN